MALLILMRGGEVHDLWSSFSAALSPYPVYAAGDDYDPQSVHYVLAWQPEKGDFDGLTNLKAILSFGAGVDGILRNEELPATLPIVRFVDTDLSQRMREYVVAEVTRHHRLDSTYRAAQHNKEWIGTFPRRANEIGVGIMGLGEMGQSTVQGLRPLGYQLRGWSRHHKRIDGVESFAGMAELDAFLQGTDILVNLLPLTPETTGILNRTLFKKLRRDVLDGGPALINAARGGHMNATELLAALGDGTLGAASLDVFDREPLDAQSGFWSVPNCYVTPHVAAVSGKSALVSYVANTIKAHEAGAPLENLVDRDRGY